MVIGISKRHLDPDSNIIQKKELMIRGSRNAIKAGFPDLIAWVTENQQAVAPMITDLYPFTQAADAFREFAAGPPPSSR